MYKFDKNLINLGYCQEYFSWFATQYNNNHPSILEANNTYYNKEPNSFYVFVQQNILLFLKRRFIIIEK